MLDPYKPKNRFTSSQQYNVNPVMNNSLLAKLKLAEGPQIFIDNHKLKDEGRLRLETHPEDEATVPSANSQKLIVRSNTLVPAQE